MDARIVAYVERNLDRYLADLAELVSLDSGSDDKVGVDAVNGWLQRRLEAMGFDLERFSRTRHGDDLLARAHGSGPARILLFGHTDTVYPRGTAATRPMTIEGDRVLGPGTCDMKAGLLSGIYALDALHEIGWDRFDLLTYLTVSDEEVGERHSIPLLIEEGARHDAVLTLEAARENGDVVTVRKAVRWYTVEAFGRAAHAGVEPEKGRSAAVALARFIVEADHLNAPRDGMTVNVGEIRGGGRPSVVVEYASARFDLRAWTEVDLDRLEAALRELATIVVTPGMRLEVTLEPGSACPPLERTPGVQALERLAVDIAAELGFPLAGAATGGASDVSYACQTGTPGLDGLGPVGGLDHSPDEYVVRSSIVPRTALLANLIVAIGERGRRL